MAKKLSLLKPELKQKYLRNAVSEHVEYIDVPGDIGIDALQSDIKNGAVHMKELEQLITKKKEPKYIIINAENEEQGYMAVSYMAACFAQKHHVIEKEEDLGEVTEASDTEENEKPEYIELPEDEDNWEEECWQETAYRVPVISVVELMAEFNKNRDPFSPFTSGNFMIGAEGKHLRHEPYWFQCRREAVCINMKEALSSNMHVGFGMDNTDTYMDGLRFFAKNDKVYIINVQRRTYYEPIEDEEYESETEQYIEAYPLKNQILLAFSADEATVCLKKESEKKHYFANILWSWFNRYGMKAKKGFKYEPIINIIMAMENSNICNMIEKVLQYAIKDKDTVEGLGLTNADFAFIDRFVTSYGGKKGKSEKYAKSAREQLEQELIGMDTIKQQVMDVVNVMKFNKIRESMGIRGAQYHNVHLMLGAPGTAKTTVAKLMGEIMMEEKLLPCNRFSCINGAELKGMYVGHSAPKVKSLFDNNDIIVIDEAYSIVDMRGETDSFSNEAIAQLVIELENHATDKLVIFAGYGGQNVSERNNRMKPFLDANPGIKSRINSTFYFESYQADEMVGIFGKLAQNEHYQIEEGAEHDLWQYFESRRMDNNFGNGREARSLLEASLLEMSKRVLGQKGKGKLTKKDVRFIYAEDIKKAIGRARIANEVQHGRGVKPIGF